MRRVLVALFITYVFVAIGHGQNSISVSQESTPGAGDFSSNLLGNITIFDQSTLTVEEIYQLGTTVPGSYNGTLTPSLSNTTQIFFVRTLDGLSLFVLHDHPDSD